MLTSTFVGLMERAYTELYRKVNPFITVQYDPDPQDPEGPPAECLGILVGEDEHMAAIAAQAMYLLWKDMMPEDGLDADAISELDEEMTDLMALIGTMRIAPYMQWHVAYFEWANPDDGDRNLTEVLGPADLAAGTGGGDVDPERLMTMLQHHGANAAWYSGRGMMGRMCVGISGSPQECMDSVARLAAELDDPDVASGVLSNFCQDQFGEGVVWYWPEHLKSETEGE